MPSDPDIARFSSYVGGGAIRFYLPLDVQLDNDFMAETVVVAKDLEARDRVQARLEALFADSFPDVTARISRLELGPPVGWPVQYRVSAPTTDEARRYAEQLATDPAVIRPRAQRQLRLGREEQGAAHRRRPGSRASGRPELRTARPGTQPRAQRLDGHAASRLDLSGRCRGASRERASARASRPCAIFRSPPRRAPRCPCASLPSSSMISTRAMSGVAAACPPSPSRRSRCRGCSRPPFTSDSPARSRSCASRCRRAR